MKRLTVSLLMTALLSSSALAQLSWTGTSSSTLDDPGNWSPSMPADFGGTDDIRFDGYSTDLLHWPVIDSAIYHLWGVARARGPGLHLTQVGGFLEWLNGSGSSSRGFTLFSRPVNYPIADEVHNPTVVRLLGGIMVTDAVGVGTTGGINRGTLYSVGGDYAEDTGTYKNWQTTPGDNAYGWGRLEVGGNATLIVRPNRYAWPVGYAETNIYWVYAVTNFPTATNYCRLFDIAISTNSQMIISDNGKVVAPYKIYTNAIVPQYNDPDLLTQLKYYAGLVQAGASPHYVSNGALSGARLVAGPGQTLQFDLYPAGTNEVNEPYGGYLTVTAVPAPFAGLQQIGASGLAVSGLVGRVYQIESADDLTQPIAWSVRTNFTLTTSPQTWNDPAPSSTARYYRAALLPLP